MTNEDMLQDLKNYIDLKNDALATRLKKEIGDELEAKLDALDEKIEQRTREILGAVGDSMIPRIECCETRLDKLEATAA